MPSGGGVMGGGGEGAGGASLLLCMQDFLGFSIEGGDTPLSCLGKGKRKHHLGQHKSHRGQVAELSPAGGAKDLGGM